MRSSVILVLSGLLTAATACGDDGPSGEADSGVDAYDLDAPPAGDLESRILALPGVQSIDEIPTDAPGYRSYLIELDQPVDHGDPDGQHFTQHLMLLHLDEDAPLVLATTGYGNYYIDAEDARFELTRLLSANQLLIEHRYFKPSRPAPADWSLLTVEQAAMDHHVVSTLFHEIYGGSWVSTGGSKGGMTSIYHRRYHPEDVDATVAYVAPHSLGPGDTRYDAYFDDVLPAECLARVRAFQVDLLSNRFDEMVVRAEAEAELRGYVYGRVSLEAAVESSIADIEWSFFQRIGVIYCEDIPGADQPDNDYVFEWLNYISEPSGLSDDQIEAFEPYYYQASAELGYPSVEQPHIADLLQFGPEAYDGIAPQDLAEPPVYDGQAMLEVADFVRDEATETMFIYGQFDPWTAGAFDLGTNGSIYRFDVTAGPHYSRIVNLGEDDLAQAFGLLEDWLGVTPVIPPDEAAAPPAWGLDLEPRFSRHALRMAAQRGRDL